MNKLFTILMAVTLIMFTACNESLLDIEQRGVVSEGSYYQTDEQAVSNVATLYRLWKTQLYNGAAIFNHMTPDSYSGGGMRNDRYQWQEENEFRHTTEDTYIINYFKNLYVMLYNANTILEKFADDSNEKQRVKAEAKFFRAWANFMLVTLWGTPYYVDHVLSTSEYQLPNAESPEIFWTAIEKDLTEAISSGLLPSKISVNDQETGLRITRECAQAYLGKAYLWQEKYSEAAAMLQQVINTGKYELVDDISIMFRSEGDHCKEYLAEAEALNDVANYNKQSGVSGSYFAWKFTGNIVLNQNTDKWPYQHQGGWGFFHPTFEIVDLVRSVEGEDGKRFKNYFIHWDYMESYYGATATRNHFQNNGWFQTKLLSGQNDDFSDVSSSGWNYTHQNWPHMRYAEVLLMASEAYLMSNDMPKAVQYFNEIRSRANAPIVSTLDIETLLKERRIELWGESPVIFQDIQRYRLGEELCGNQFEQYPTYDVINHEIIWTDNGYAEYGFKEKHYLLPYSNSELTANPNLKQNPGW